MGSHCWAAPLQQVSLLPLRMWLAIVAVAVMELARQRSGVARELIRFALLPKRAKKTKTELWPLLTLFPAAADAALTARSLLSAEASASSCTASSL